MNRSERERAVELLLLILETILLLFNVVALG